MEKEIQSLPRILPKTGISCFRGDRCLYTEVPQLGDNDYHQQRILKKSQTLALIQALKQHPIKGKKKYITFSKKYNQTRTMCLASDSAHRRVPAGLKLNQPMQPF